MKFTNRGKGEMHEVYLLCNKNCGCVSLATMKIGISYKRVAHPKNIQKTDSLLKEGELF